MKKFLVIFFCIWSLLGFAQKPHQQSASEIYAQIKKLSVLGNVLYLAAHPDDENTRFIAYCANEKLFNTGYLSITRGDGGQNLIGNEIGIELGIIRTQELLAARRMDGGTQFFTRANDFGYSKTADETFKIWDKQKVLADVVWVIRQFKPDVIVCRFPPDERAGHGHHTASAVLGGEAFQMAADKNAFPEQLQYVDVWQPKRIVLNTGRWWNDKISANDKGVTAENIGLYNPALGTSYNELSALSRTMHKSQGFGSTGARGESMEFFEHFKGEEAQQNLFENIDFSWNRIEGGKKIEKAIQKLIKTYDVANPEKSVLQLLNIRAEIQKINDTFWRNIKISEIDDIIKHCLGLYLEAKADDFMKSEGDSLKIDFEIINRSNVAVNILELKSTVLGKTDVKKSLIKNAKLEMKQGYVMPFLPVSQPYWLVAEGSVGTYAVDDQKLIGKPENDAAVSFEVLLEISEHQITYNVPLIYKWNDPVKGELYRPFIVVPKVMVNVGEPIVLFSTQDEKTIEITLKSGAANQSGNIEFKLPENWIAEYEKSFNIIKKGDEKKIPIKLKPLQNAVNGDLQIFVNGSKAQSLKNISYDHIPPQSWFPDAKMKLVYVDIKKDGNKVAYIIGAGDIVPDALRNIGYQVDILQESDINPEKLKNYKALILGIRALNTIERIDFMMPKLLEYCHDGGNLILQYNTSHAVKTKNFAPYDLKLSRDRVTEENAEVTFLLPQHNVLNVPNKITSADFEKWEQERGLYFPNEWDERYEAVFSMNDKGETPKKGALLIAPYGKGYYVYTGLSFFRELPAGVPGAYRLLVNIISLE